MCSSIVKLSNPLMQKLTHLGLMMLVITENSFYYMDTIVALKQGPKLTFLGRRQLATEMFFSVAIWKNVVTRKCQ